MLRRKPDKTAFNPPRPSATRRVWCPQCGHVFEASQRAMSLRCPKCTNPVKPGDLDITQSVRGNLTVGGHVHIRSSMALTGELACGELTNSGQLRGKVRVGGAVKLLAGSHTIAQMRCQSLEVAPGAKLRAAAAIGTLANFKFKTSDPPKRP